MVGQIGRVAWKHTPYLFSLLFICWRDRPPTLVFWPREFHGLYSPWGHKESDTTEQVLLHFTSLSLDTLIFQKSYCIPRAFRNSLNSIFIAHQTFLSMEFSRQEYWSRLPFPTPEDLPDPGLNQCLLSWQANSSLLHHLAQTVKNLPAMRETWVWYLGQEDPLEKGMSTHSSILAWRIPCTEETGRLQSIGLQKVVHHWATFTFTLHFNLLPWSPSCIPTMAAVLSSIYLTVKLQSKIGLCTVGSGKLLKLLGKVCLRHIILASIFRIN